MPNTPALVDEAMTAISAGDARREHLAVAESLLAAVGRWSGCPSSSWTPSPRMSGSGPAYFFFLVEAMIDAGILLGLPRATATELIVQTAIGSAMMLRDTGEHPRSMRERVTSPGRHHDRRDPRTRGPRGSRCVARRRSRPPRSDHTSWPPETVTVTVRRVPPDDWESHRDLRLEMLPAAPDAFFSPVRRRRRLRRAPWRGGRHAVPLPGPPRGRPGRLGRRGTTPRRLATPRPSSRCTSPRRSPRRRSGRAPGPGGPRRGRRARSEAGRPRGHRRNVPAIRLYERMGFVADGTLARCPARPELEELGMERVLETPVPEAGGDVAAWRRDRVTVRSLGEEAWRGFRAIRLAAPRTRPRRVRPTSVARTSGCEEDFWRLRLRRSTRLVRGAAAPRLAGQHGRSVGRSLSLGEGADPEGRVAAIFGLGGGPRRSGHRRRDQDRRAHDGRVHAVLRRPPHGTSGASSGRAPPTTAVTVVVRPPDRLHRAAAPDALPMRATPGVPATATPTGPRSTATVPSPRPSATAGR